MLCGTGATVVIFSYDAKCTHHLSCKKESDYTFWILNIAAKLCPKPCRFLCDCEGSTEVFPSVYIYTVSHFIFRSNSSAEQMGVKFFTQEHPRGTKSSALAFCRFCPAASLDEDTSLIYLLVDKLTASFLLAASFEHLLCLSKDVFSGFWVELEFPFAPVITLDSSCENILIKLYGYDKKRP